jgi:chaperonin cofactor prefoldin
MLAINVQMEQVAAGSTSQKQNVKNLSDKLALLEQRNNALSSRISTLENELRNLATKVVSGGNSPAAGGTPPQ